MCISAVLVGVIGWTLLGATNAFGQSAAAELPDGVRAVWDLAKAYRQATPTRERVCINGLWRWQPAADGAERVPADGWGYFKVPAPWPQGRKDDPQTVYPNPRWQNANLGQITAAWYRREINVPADWQGRRIVLSIECLNSFATVYVDGVKAAEARFPGGDVDITAACKTGARHTLSLRVVAMPLSSVIMSYSQTNEAQLVQGRVARRGLCGDVYLAGVPPRARVEDVKVDTSVRNWAITFDTALALEAGRSYALRARILDGDRQVATFTSDRFGADDLKNGRFAFTAPWHPQKLWDVNTPQNVYTVGLSLLDADGGLIDVFLPVRFGFREFWIQGRDFYLNGTRIFCPIAPFENANRGPHDATYEEARETFLALRKMGINTVFTHYYNCQPGVHLALDDILRAADDVGMLVSLTQPHPGNYDWDAPDAAETNGYARHAAYYVRVAENHPSVVMYAMSHNSTGYEEDMNPDQIGMKGTPERTPWSENNMKRALQGEAIVRRLDDTRVIYHHSSGNLSGIYTSNFYLNFVPIQERSDYFEHWAEKGDFPAILVEYGPPLPPCWTMYRGWYKGKRAYLSAKVAWELCTGEWASQFLGDRAYDLTDKEKADMRFEAARFRAGKTWQRFQYPYGFNSAEFEVPNRCDVQAMYIQDNWRAYRTWGLSAPGCWSYDRFFVTPAGFKAEDRRPAVDWDDLQRPGYSVDLVPAEARITDWVPNSAGKAFLRNNQPLLAYIGGKPGDFTGKDHDFQAGQTVEKQIIVINNTRQTVEGRCSWSLGLPTPQQGSQAVHVETGQIAHVPLSIPLPADLPAGTYHLTMTMTPDPGQAQQDTFAINVLPATPHVEIAGRVALFDPRGETAKLLERLGVRSAAVSASADLKGYDVLIVGNGALTLTDPAPDISAVRDGLKVVMFEQTSDALEKRLGFRVQEYGLRRVFERVPDHPLLDGLGDQDLHDWAGEATLLPPRLKYEMWRQHGPSIVRSGIKVTRPWRAGCRGNVASVLIEKPTCGDFLPIVDGGFSLQYSPLMVHREGKGMVLFCQMDVTGRSEMDPAAMRLAANILNYAAAYRPAPERGVLYVGEEAGRRQLEAAGIAVRTYGGGKLSPDQVLVVGPGGNTQLNPHAAAVAEMLRAGGRVVCLALSGAEASTFLPFQVSTHRAEHICTEFSPVRVSSPLAGVGPADVLNRDPRQVDLVSGGADAMGDGVLAVGDDGGVVFCQLAPWQFDYERFYNMKRTFRRTSFVLSRVLTNMGVQGRTRVLERFARPVAKAQDEERWLNGLYLDKPEEFDDPYRYFRW